MQGRCGNVDLLFGSFGSEFLHRNLPLRLMLVPEGPVLVPSLPVRPCLQEGLESGLFYEGGLSQCLQWVGADFV